MRSSHTRPAVALCIAALSYCVIAPVLAKASDSAVITMERAIQKTLARNPDLVAFGYQIEAGKGRLTQAHLRPNPELAIEVENVLGSNRFSGIESAETTLSLGWIFERGKRDGRIAAADASMSLLAANLHAQRVDAGAEAANLYLEALANQERQTLNREAVALAEQTVKVVNQRVTAGRAPDADLARAQASLARDRLALDDVSHELLTTYHQLAAQWGAREPDFLRLSGDISQIPTPASFAEFLARIDRNPNILRYLNQKRLGEAQLRLAQANARPDWRLSAGVRRLEAADTQALVAGITIPLALRNRNQGAIAEAHARLAGVDAGEAAERLQIETHLFARHQELQHSLHRINALQNEIIPKVEQALADTQRAYASGRYGYLALQLLQAEVLSARSALLEENLNAHKHLVDIERLTGTPFSAGVSQQ